MFRSVPLLFVIAVPSMAVAQRLPVPAHAPAAQSNNKTSDAILDAPPSNELPIIIGEPVRHQTPSTPVLKPSPRSGNVVGVSVAGLSDEQALDHIRTALEPQLKLPFRTVIGSYQYTFRREELGAGLSLRPMLTHARRGENAGLQLSVDRAKLESALRELDAQVRDDFGKVGLDVPASARRIEAALEHDPPLLRTELVTMRVREAVPPPEEPTDTHPTGKGSFPFLLASFSTKYDGSLRGRTVNLRMAANHINGTVVAPGAVFSTNSAIGPRNAASGWREAKMFVSGRVVAGTGAGICQAASTLYNCALLGNFSIIERHAHSMRVSYVPPSRDAALMWNQKDFKFRNTSGAPIKVETFVADGKFNARVWGQKARNAPKIELISMVTSRSGGTHSQAFKLVGGQKVRLSSDFYRPHP